MRLLEKQSEKHSPQLDTIHQLVQKDFDCVNQLVQTELHSDIERINEITEHLVNSGGKRIRPLVLLLTANNLGYRSGSEHQELATIVEFIHISTLLHDDVVDDSTLRRHQPTANAVWGNAASVLAGDFLYSRAFQLLAKRSNIPVMKVLANTTNQIAEGEVMQLLNRENSELSEEDYFDVIRRKTAQLYAACCEIAALIALPNDNTMHSHCAQYGINLGMAFQIVDDLLDYTADAATMGKNIGDDLAEGKMTLPLIYTLRNGSNNDKKITREAIQSGNRDAIKAIVAAINSNNACDYAAQCAQKYITNARKALNHLPANQYRDALAQLCEFVLSRSY